MIFVTFQRSALDDIKNEKGGVPKQFRKPLLQNMTDNCLDFGLQIAGRWFEVISAKNAGIE